MARGLNRMYLTEVRACEGGLVSQAQGELGARRQQGGEFGSRAKAPVFFCRFQGAGV